MKITKFSKKLENYNFFKPFPYEINYKKVPPVNPTYISSFTHVKGSRSSINFNWWNCVMHKNGRQAFKSWYYQ